MSDDALRATTDRVKALADANPLTQVQVDALLHEHAALDGMAPNA